MNRRIKQLHALPRGKLSTFMLGFPYPCIYHCISTLSYQTITHELSILPYIVWYIYGGFSMDNTCQVGGQITGEFRWRRWAASATAMDYDDYSTGTHLLVYRTHL